MRWASITAPLHWMTCGREGRHPPWAETRPFWLAPISAQKRKGWKREIQQRYPHIHLKDIFARIWIEVEDFCTKEERLEERNSTKVSTYPFERHICENLDGSGRLHCVMPTRVGNHADHQ